MKKIVLVSLLSIFLVGCGNQGSIDHTEYERVKDFCDRNGGIEKIMYAELSNNSVIKDMIVGVKCEDGTIITEEHSQSAKRIQRVER